MEKKKRPFGLEASITNTDLIEIFSKVRITCILKTGYSSSFAPQGYLTNE